MLAFGSDWFLDLPYRVVAIRQVLNMGDAHRARQHVCPTGSPGTAELWFTFVCTDITCSVGLLFKKYAVVPTQSISLYHCSPVRRGMANSPFLKLGFLNFVYFNLRLFIKE